MELRGDTRMTWLEMLWEDRKLPVKRSSCWKAGAFFVCGNYVSQGVCPHGFWQAAARRKTGQGAEGKWESRPTIIRESRKTRCAKVMEISLCGAFALPALLQKFLIDRVWLFALNFNEGIFFCLLTISRRSYMHAFFELFRKIGTIMKTDATGNFINGFFGFSK